MTQRILFKIGTSTLTAGSKQIHAPTLLEVVRQLAQLARAGTEVLLVTSGAVAVGRARLASPVFSKTMPARQMLAAIGQPRLMALYDQMFGFYDCPVAQVLLTRRDLTYRGSYLNARNTLQALLSQRVIPIINENDTTGTEEIRIGDNDNLAALVACAMNVDLLVLLTDQDGIYTADPRNDPNATLIPTINGYDIPESVWQAAGGGSQLGTGGVVTKLQAAQLAARAGVPTRVVQGRAPNILLRVAGGEAIGTFFTPQKPALPSYRRFILSGWDKKSRILIDEGAAEALHTGKSLLAVGVRSVVGDFDAGETVAVCDLTQREIARGIPNYSAKEISLIIGHHSEQIPAILGYSAGDEVIHRDYLVLV